MVRDRKRLEIPGIQENVLRKYGVFSLDTFHLTQESSEEGFTKSEFLFLWFYSSRLLKARDATARTMLKQVAVQPRPYEYPQKLLELILFAVKTAIDTTEEIAEKQIF